MAKEEPHILGPSLRAWGLAALTLACGSPATACGGSTAADGDPEDRVGVGAGGQEVDASVEPDAAPDDSPVPAGDTLIALGVGEVDALRDSACAGWTAEYEMLPLTMMLAVDMSESMMATTAVTSGRSKWEVTRDSLVDGVGGLPDGSLLGMLLFPNLATSPSLDARTALACVALDALIPCAAVGSLGSDQRLQIGAVLARSGPIAPAATPLQDAYAVAVDAVLASAGLSAPVVALVTDGQPTLSQGCVGLGMPENPVDEQPLLRDIASALASGVRTLVVGTPGSEDNVATDVDARPWLSEAAEAGGIPRSGCSHDGPEYCHLDLSGETDFGAAIFDLARLRTCGAPPCALSIPLPPPGERLDLDTAQVMFIDDTGMYLVPRSESEACESGWQINAAGTELAFCDATCAALSTTHCGTLELLLACDDSLVPPP